MPAKKHKTITRTRFDWLPFESWLIPDIFRFSRIKGYAKIFLIIEIVLAVLIVFGTFGACIIKVIRQFSP